MKKRCFCFLMCLLLGHGLAGLSAAAASAGELYQYTVLEDGTAEITGYTGNETNLVIPSELNGTLVSSIGDYAFEGRENLISVTVPDGVVSICNFAFHNCINLSEILLPDSVSRIGGYAFSSCESLTSVIIPDGVTEIEYSLFSGNINLTTVTLPEGVASIGENSFFGCRKLTNLRLPDSLRVIDEWAFACCESLTSVTIPEGVTTIARDAFFACEKLTDLILPASLRVIDEGAFSCCRTLTAVKIPEGVTEIGTKAFACCESLTSVTIPEGVTTIARDAFFACEKLTDLILPASLRVIDEGAFSCCRTLTAVKIPEGVTEIGTKAFAWCTELADLNLPSSLTFLGNGAFTGCSRLKSVSIPDSLTYMGDNPFAGCYYLDAISISPDHQALEIRDGVLFSREDKRLIWYSRTRKDRQYEVPQGTAVIGGRAFYQCRYLYTLVLPDSVTTIKESAFEGSNLMNVNLPNSVTNLGARAFAESHLTSIAIPEEIKTIGDELFYGCKFLDTAVIPAGVVSIGNRAFGECTRLTASVTPGTYADFYCKAHHIRTVQPAEEKEILVAGDYGYRILSDGTAEIVRYLGEEEKVVIPSSLEGLKVTSIGDEAFLMSKLSSVTIPNTVVQVGINPFAACDNLGEILTDPGHPVLETVEGVLFSKVNIVVGPSTVDRDEIFNPFVTRANLREVTKVEAILSGKADRRLICYPINKGGAGYTIPKGTLEIGKYAFLGTHLTNVKITAGVTDIGEQAFEGSLELTEVTVPDSVTFIGKDAFIWCDKLTLTVPDGYVQEYCEKNRLKYVLSASTPTVAPRNTPAEKTGTRKPTEKIVTKTPLPLYPDNTSWTKKTNSTKTKTSEDSHFYISFMVDMMNLGFCFHNFQFKQQEKSK